MLKRFLMRDLDFKEKPGPTKIIRDLKKAHCIICGKLIPLNTNATKYCSATCKAIRNYVVDRGGAI